MYLANLKLWNFRKFGGGDIDLDNPHLNLDFNKSLNVLVGENDSGKTAIIDSIKLVLKTHSFEWIKVVDSDFHNDAETLRIELLFKDFSDEEARHFTDWIGMEEVTQEEGDNRDEGNEVTEQEPEGIPYLKLMYEVTRNALRILPNEVKAGSDSVGIPLTPDAKDYLKTTYLKPLRDAKSDLIPKRHSRLSKIFHGHEAFKDKDDDHYLIEVFRYFNSSIEKYFEGKKVLLDDNGSEVISDLEDLKGKELRDEIDSYLLTFFRDEKKSNIQVNDGTLIKILEKLELSIKEEENLGLGTLNRLFMATELLHLNKNNWDGLRLGLVEELEAHLHPQAQMMVIKSLERFNGIQLILTTHSPNLTSKIGLENLILCVNNGAYPLGKSYTKLKSDDYIFLEKFLDVTKSNLFYSKGLIFVEGWAEEILIPTISKFLKFREVINRDLTDAGVSIVNVNSLAFNRYSKILLRSDNQNLGIPIAIVTDNDVKEYVKKPKVDENGRVLSENVAGKEKVVHDYIKIQNEELQAKITEKNNSLREIYEDGDIKTFISPNWTLEYCLFKSTTIGTIFKEVLSEVHTQINQENLEAELAKKLINSSLKKTEIAYELSKKLEQKMADINIVENDEHLNYLINAIKYAIGN